MYTKVTEILKEKILNNEKIYIKRYIVTDLLNNVVFDNNGNGYMSIKDAKNIMQLGYEKDAVILEPKTEIVENLTSPIVEEITLKDSENIKTESYEEEYIPTTYLEKKSKKSKTTTSY